MKALASERRERPNLLGSVGKMQCVNAPIFNDDDEFPTGLTTATENIQARDDGSQVTLPYADWQRVLAVQMLLARFYFSEPDVRGSQLGNDFCHIPSLREQGLVSLNRFL